MKVKLSEVVQSAEQIKALLELGLPVKVSYKILRLVNNLNPILEIYNTKRNDLIKELGEKNEKDENFSVKDPAKLKEFATRLTELLDIEEEIAFEPIKITELGEVNVAAKNLVSFMFTE